MWNNRMNISVSSHFEENMQIYWEAPVGAENSSYRNPDCPNCLTGDSCFFCLQMKLRISSLLLTLLCYLLKRATATAQWTMSLCRSIWKWKQWARLRFPSPSSTMDICKSVLIKGPGVLQSPGVAPESSNFVLSGFQSSINKTITLFLVVLSLLHWNCLLLWI